MIDVCSDGNRFATSVTVDVFKMDSKILVVSAQYFLHYQTGSVPARQELHHCILLRVRFVVGKVIIVTGVFTNTSIFSCHSLSTNVSCSCFIRLISKLCNVSNDSIGKLNTSTSISVSAGLLIQAVYFTNCFGNAHNAFL